MGSALHTEEIEFGLLLTPTTREEVMDMDKFKERMEKYDNGTTIPNLATQVVGMLPTPTTKNVTGGAVKVNENGKRQNKGGTEFSAQLHDLALSQMLPGQDAGQGSQLSPLFVEEMMGFPKNWTASPFQSGDEKA